MYRRFSLVFFAIIVLQYMQVSVVECFHPYLVSVFYTASLHLCVGGGRGECNALASLVHFVVCKVNQGRYPFCCGKCKSLLCRSTIGRQLTCKQSGESFWMSCDQVANHCCAERFCTRQYKKEYKLSSERVRDWSEYCKQMCSAPNKHPPHILTCQAEAGFVGLCSKFAIKMGNPIPRILYTSFAVGFYITLLVNSTLPCTSITLQGNWT